MIYTASIYFLGQYRPAYFEADTPHHAMRAALSAFGPSHPDYRWFSERLQQACMQVRKISCAAWSSEHGCRGVSLREGKHDPFLDSVTRSLPAYPGLEYAGAANV